ncbi:uncharacterized protein CDV56_102542 [Aspergillus thermomutatus]|uniref:Uncharacterized protein n=1 Tax=Aspergillus thermomutatus TaxID=41047 RepID=A0A397HBT9_ASPTH|nr:uncharacterized protein CDV56_102542 [Aspergillus thermomutatus]RHZ60437.1 hypothetical protein CDV56_102542 [Aspergillus thermomutatus]
MDPKPRPSDIALLDDYLSHPVLKPDVSWGFNIYRCGYSSDKAWQRMLHLIDETIQETLEVNDAMEMYPRHKPVIVDDREILEGATSHDVRDRFIAWVSEEVPRVVSRPEEFFAREEFSTTLRREWTLDEGSRGEATLGQWGPLEPHERNYAVHPDYEDGETDEDDEDVGWTYMSVIDYMRYYNHLNEYDWWYNFYARPPYMIEEEQIPGSWRKG